LHDADAFTEDLEGEGSPARHVGKYS